MEQKRRFFTPGPTMTPPELTQELAAVRLYHRSKEYAQFFTELERRLRYVFCTKNRVLTFGSSGTGAMEAAVANLLCQGNKVLVVTAGRFGNRWAEICRAYGVDVMVREAPWGETVPPDTVEQVLAACPKIRAVFCTLCETSTGARHDIAASGDIVRHHQAVLVVDAISGLCADELATDEWGVDVAVAASQKGLMVPPGLAFASVSPKAWELVRRSDLPKYYFSFLKASQAMERGLNPFTPPITLVQALGRSLSMIEKEGLGNVIARHARLGRAMRAGVLSLGLRVFPRNPSNALTVIELPPAISGDKVVKLMAERHGAIAAGGQDHMKGKLVRIAHMGYFDEMDLISALSALESVLRLLGHTSMPGDGVAAAQEVLAEGGTG